ncbi:MAG: hypothetical protein SV186_00080 [Candidatus Nanohaloarchaea archaeon]|nr:hypothetical protein [Candidatus Nanohaloarchaea archaeon]
MRQYHEKVELEVDTEAGTVEETDRYRLEKRPEAVLDEEVDWLPYDVDQ